MRLCPDLCYQLGIEDPPYGIKEDGRKTKGRSVKKDGSFIRKIDRRNGVQMIIKPKDYRLGQWDNEIPADEYFQQLFRITQNQIIWGANYFPSVCGTAFKAPRRREYDQFIKDHPTNWIIWDKVNGDNDFSDCELAWTSFPVKTEIFYFMWAGMLQGLSMKEGQTMQGNKRLNENRIHSAQKPLPLHQYALTKFATAGDIIFDSHMGSQSLRIVAHKMGFDYVGCEINKDIYNSGCRRYEKEVMMPLFDS